MTALVGRKPRRPGSSRGLSALGVAALGLCTAGCAHQAAAEQSAHKARQVEVRRLRSQLAERDQEVQSLAQRLSEAEAEQQALRRALTERESAPREASCPPDDPVHEMPAPSARRARTMLRLHEQGGARRRSPGPLAAVPETDERLPLAPVPSRSSHRHAPSTTAAAEAEYVRALDLVRRRSFDQALAVLDHFLLEYPSEPRAVRARLWRGEVLFAQGAYQRALDDFEEALVRDLSSEQAAGALLKIALCYQRLGNGVRARAAVERLKRDYPSTKAARLAGKDDV